MIVVLQKCRAYGAGFTDDRAANPRTRIFKGTAEVPPSPWRRVALLGIAQSSVKVKYPANLGHQKRANVLSLNIKTAGDWLKVKRMEKNLTLGHVAAKMGVATS